jgi:hypothetical protein
MKDGIRWTSNMGWVLVMMRMNWFNMMGILRMALDMAMVRLILFRGILVNRVGIRKDSIRGIRESLMLMRINILRIHLIIIMIVRLRRRV